MTRITHLALAAVTSLGIAFSPVPAAAGPDAEDVAAAIAGIAILGLIAKNRSDNRKKRSVVTPTYDVFETRERFRGDRRIIEGDLSRPGGVERRDRRRDFRSVALPDRCLRQLDTVRGTRLVYARHCLNRRYQHANRLPQHCERLVRTDRGVRTVFGARCLRRDGWRVARR